MSTGSIRTVPSRCTPSSRSASSTGLAPSRAMSAVTTSPGGMTEAPAQHAEPGDALGPVSSGTTSSVSPSGTEMRSDSTGSVCRAQTPDAGRDVRDRHPAWCVERGRRQALAPTRKSTQPSFIRSTWPGVNSFMQESCV